MLPGGCHSNYMQWVMHETSTKLTCKSAHKFHRTKPVSIPSTTHGYPAYPRRISKSHTQNTISSSVSQVGQTRKKRGGKEKKIKSQKSKSKEVISSQQGPVFAQSCAVIRQSVVWSCLSNLKPIHLSPITPTWRQRSPGRWRPRCRTPHQSRSRRCSRPHRR